MVGSKAARDANTTVVVDDGDGGLVVNIGVVLVLVMVTVTVIEVMTRIMTAIGGDVSWCR